MSEPDKSQDIERGAAEEASDAPPTEMEREVSLPPEERWSGHADSDNED